MERIKKHKKQFIEIGMFFLFFSIFLVLNMFRSIKSDEIWCYGFSYNISRGLLIYKDFNVVPTPFSFLLGSLFIKLLGPYYISIIILNSILAGISGVLLYRLISWKSIFVYAPIFFITPSPYNFLCLFFLIWILYLLCDEKKNHDLLIAFLTGLVFMTKQNVGAAIFLPMFIYSKKKIKSIFIFLVPFLFICLLFLFQGSLFEFIDYSFLGLFDFQKSNTYVESISLLVFEIIIIIYLSFCIIKGRFKDKEAMFILAFQMVIYPSLDHIHFFTSLVPVLYYISKHFSKRMLLYPMYAALLIFCCCYYSLAVDKISTKNNFMYLKAPERIVTVADKLNDYFAGDLQNVYINSELSYFIKLLYNVPIGKFDLLNNGNMGSNKKEIFHNLKKYCSQETCYFVLEKYSSGQFQYMEEFVKDNYTKVDNIETFTIYTSKKLE